MGIPQSSIWTGFSMKWTILGVPLYGYYGKKPYLHGHFSSPSPWWDQNPIRAASPCRWCPDCFQTWTPCRPTSCEAFFESSVHVGAMRQCLDWMRDEWWVRILKWPTCFRAIVHISNGYQQKKRGLPMTLVQKTDEGNQGWLRWLTCRNKMDLRWSGGLGPTVRVGKQVTTSSWICLWDRLPSTPGLVLPSLNPSPPYATLQLVNWNQPLKRGVQIAENIMWAKQ